MQETISLYLQLAEGQKADFEVVGLSAAAFAEAVKAIADIIEPGLDLRLEFVSGTEGSLNLKAILKTLASPNTRRNALLAVIATVAGWLTNDIRTYGVVKLLDAFLFPQQRMQLSDDDIKRITKAITDINRGKIAKAPVQEMYRQLDRDDNIRSVGTISHDEARPLNPIPRSEFQTRAGIVSRVEISSKSHKTPSIERLTIISPVLLEKDRVWRLRSQFGEFSYHFEDTPFLHDLLTGKRRLPMREGIQITADVLTEEKREGGVWIPTKRSIIGVRAVHREKSGESDLFTQPKKGNPRDQ